MSDYERGLSKAQAMLKDLNDRSGLRWAIDEISASTLAKVLLQGAMAIVAGPVHRATAQQFIDYLAQASPGFANEWAQIDDDVRDEILNAHVAIMIGGGSDEADGEPTSSVQEIIDNDRDLFLGKLDDVVISFDDDFGKLGCRIARSAIRQTLDIVDGLDGGPGYHLIPKQPDMALVPCSQEVYDSLNTDIPFKTGLDIGGALTEYFDAINS